MTLETTSPHLPVVEPARGPLDTEQRFQRFAHLPYALFLDSALVRPHLGRYSFLAADPFEVLRIPVGEKGSPGPAGDPLGELARRMRPWSAPTIPGLPPFQGGAAGLLSYDLHHSLEQIPAPECNEFPLPALTVGLYDVVLAVDHATGEAWWISHGFPAREPAARARRARRRLTWFQQWCAGPQVEQAGGSRDARGDERLSTSQLGPQYPVPGHARLTSNFSSASYRHAVQRAIDYIAAGDAFQINLAQRLLHPALDDSPQLYLRLRRRNPATFAGYFDAGDFQILSASPERFLQLQDRQAEARPIKGTRQRLPHAEANLYAADDLLASEKDRAENVMIVDLLRNDLSAVCEPDSVRVTALCQLETYQYVQHLVSAVQGRLRDDAGPLDLVRAAFPGGSITGAPKVRAMEIIAELERTARGAYCGSLGYLGFDGSLDLNILIRTITANRGWWQMPVGGGITFQSEPQREYEETWHKAAGLLRSLPSDGADTMTTS
jgi:para-aminobenzoate synthetase component I